VEGTNYIAKVVSVKDSTAGGIIKVVNASLNGGLPITCYASAPFGGGGAGMFSVPGKHSNVIITKVSVDYNTSIWVWTSTVYLPSTNAVGVDGTPVSLDDMHIKRAESPGGTSNADDNSSYFSHGNPKFLEVYEDNNLPEGEVWVSKGGHCLEFYSKRTSERTKDGLAVRTAKGKGLVLDDGVEGAIGSLAPDELTNPITDDTEELKGAKILLVDEDGNRVEITPQSSNLISKFVVSLISGGDISIHSSSDININSEEGVVDIKTIDDSIPILVDEQLFEVNPSILVNGKPVVTYG